MANLDEIRDEVEGCKKLPDYEAVDVLWVALVKAANLKPGRDEYARMKELARGLRPVDVATLLKSEAVNRLLDLDPPLETILADPHEKLEPVRTAQAIAGIRKEKDAEPLKALGYLGEILKRIRNKRAHGFKSSKGPRDQQILGAARTVLSELCDLAIR